MRSRWCVTVRILHARCSGLIPLTRRRSPQIGPTTLANMRLIGLSMSFSFEPPKSYSAKKRAGMNGSPHTSKPDFDNIEKFYKDMSNE